jgi:LysR family transcriptional regulator, benzoate and cis,cis-muconate-responsive activator of ben and cat genes
VDLEQHALRKFLAVVEELNFNRAAQRLHVSQPALSQAIRRLEAALGKSLFQRDSHGVALTDFGKTFGAIARTLVSQHDKAVASALQAARGERNSFHVGYSPLIDLTVVSAVRSEFARTETAVRIQVHGLPDEVQVERLITGRLNVALLMAPVDLEGLTSEIVRREPLVIGLSRDHRLAAQELISIEDVCGESLVWWPRTSNPQLYDRFFATCAEHRLVPRVAQEVTTLQESFEFVAQGLGITLLPRSATSLRHPDVVFRNLAVGGLFVEITLAYKPDEQSELLSRFIAYAKERFRREP